MARLVSAAALFAARELRAAFDFTIRLAADLPGGQAAVPAADDRCVAILIDEATQVADILRLRPELRYWQGRLFDGTAEKSAPQLGAFIQKAIDAFSRVPRFKPEERRSTITMESPQEFEMKPQVLEISKASMEASRFLFHYYHIRPKRTRVVTTADDDFLDRVAVSKIVEVSLGLFRAQKAVPLLIETKVLFSQGKLTLENLKRRFRALGILLEALPNYEHRDEEVKLLD
jgi:hypothetical protein